MVAPLGFVADGLVRPEGGWLELDLPPLARTVVEARDAEGFVDLSRLRFALKARSLGFTLGDVRELIEESEGGETPCPRVRSLIEARLAEVEARIRELSELSARMRAAMDDWSRAPDCHLGDGRVCGLIDSFNAESAAPR
ncbi:MAG: MerR family DNA-binding protein [Alcanivorax sp.]|nr:MerR family DNA-binding protein [Alcanivorax sp.]